MDTNYLIAYGLMLLFVAASFVMTSRQHQRLRRICDPFGLAFTEAAVYAIGQTNPDCKLACDEHSLPLPLHEQPAAIQRILARGADDYCKERHETMLHVAVLGTMLSIKPVMHVDDEGHLTKVGTARGRNASLKALVDHMAETAIDPAGQTVFISHGDCEGDANRVAEDVKRRFGVQTVVLNNVGPVIGAHSGPGTVALFFLGRHR